MPSSYQPCSFYCFFLCTEKYLELEIPILCLLCFVCLFVYEELSGLWPKELWLRYPEVYCALLPHSRGAFVVFVYTGRGMGKVDLKFLAASPQAAHRIPATLSRALCSVTKNGFVFP